jgi:hypothetical protein
MSETTLVVPEREIEELEVHLAARNTVEMDAARVQLKEWLTLKIRAVKQDKEELEQARDMAIKQKWGNSALRNQAAKAAQRLTFYQKVRSAVDAGYTIVPNFPVDIFAIRMDRNKPVAKTYVDTGYYNPMPTAPDVIPKALPEGEGRYVANEPTGERRTEPFKVEGKSDQIKAFFKTTGYAEVEFPVTCARPVVMNATAEAMALKVFDAIGICPARTIRRDPLIIGQIRMRESQWNDTQLVSFLIAWHLDLRTL